MVKHILIVDDDRIRHENFVAKFRVQYPEAKIDHAYTYKDAIAALEQGPKYDLVQLDHDLSDFGQFPETSPHLEGIYDFPKGVKEYTGADIAAWMAGSDALTGDRKPDMVIVHSWNPYGSKRIAEILMDAGFSVFQKLFQA